MSSKKKAMSSKEKTMNGEENAKSVNIDPQWCVPESLNRPQGQTN